MEAFLGLLLWIGAILFFVVVPLVPLAGAIWALSRILKNSDRLLTLANGLWLVAIAFCLSPYAHHLASEHYRNTLCESEGATTISFNAKEWANKNPAEAEEIKRSSETEYSKTFTKTHLNSRFVEVSNFKERDMSVREIHRQIIDTKTNTVIAETKMFLHGSTGRGNPFPFFDGFSIKPLRSCYTKPEYDFLKSDLYALTKNKDK